MFSELFGPTEDLGQVWLFAAPVGATLGCLVMDAGQRFARHWEGRHAPPVESQGPKRRSTSPVGSQVGDESFHRLNDVGGGGVAARNLAKCGAHGSDKQFGDRSR
jgi:hypothetical protein